MLMDERDYVLCEDIKDRISKKFIENGWITVSDYGIHSALVIDENVLEVLENYCWDLRRGAGMPGVSVRYVNEKPIVNYDRLGHNKYEPFVFYRDGYGTHPSYIELSEEFRLYHNLHEKYISEEEKNYVVMNNGSEEIVAKLSNISLYIKAKYVKDYLAIRKINLLIFFDIENYGSSTYSELNITLVNNQIIKGDNYIYNYTNMFEFLNEEKKSCGWIMGKCVLRYEQKTDYDPFERDNNQYLDYIIGYDDNGEELRHTCNKDFLSNYFVQKENEPLELTPVFFSKDVLNKYYANPNKYTVSDGLITCDGSWSLRVDNNCKEYVVVMLVDLGTLSYKEQLYWKGFNIAPPHKGCLSYTAYQRWIKGAWCNPISPDFVFKQKYQSFNRKWYEKYGWYLFLPLINEDEHRFKTLHCLTTLDNEQDFDEQILSLVKLFIDSLNQEELIKNIRVEEKEVIDFLEKRNVQNLKEIKTGIDKFELFVLSQQYSIPDMFDFLRKLQALRSFDVAHRKSSDKSKRKSIINFFGLDTKHKQEILDDIFRDTVKTISTLEDLFINENLGNIICKE